MPLKLLKHTRLTTGIAGRCSIKVDSVVSWSIILGRDGESEWDISSDDIRNSNGVDRSGTEEQSASSETETLERHD